MDQAGPPDPTQATTAAEYVTALSRLRRWSGLTYRQLATKAGGTLPASTVAGVLGRATLPREDFVLAFTAACGLDEAEIGRWVHARRALASDAEPPPSGAEPQPSAEPGPGPGAGAEAGGRSLVRRWWPAVAVAVGLAAALVFAPTLIRGIGEMLEGKAAASQTAAPGPLADGWYRMIPSHVAGRGLCVGEGRERSGRTDRPLAVQRPCSDPGPATKVRSLGPDVYEIQWFHPTEGTGCLTVDGAYLGDEALVAPSDCIGAAHQRFLFERDGNLGYILRPVHSGKCIGLLDGEADVHPGGELAQDACSGKRDQTFRFEPAEKPDFADSP
ncbi:XRE family transcriptional regulator [Nonomuraea typhae]|uniref:XRE family transcriptional regulator n=1 Tax=Nonomuraea typhae TaxID=2603600 RepID=UPI0012FCC318|nr:XRE family transcriptional regulator [Nonomuraea typhae]